MIVCPNCGSHMPEGVAYCQKCGSPMHNNADRSASAADSRESEMMAALKKHSRALGWSANSVRSLPSELSGMDNLLMVSPEISVLVAYSSSRLSEKVWEALVLAKYRMGADILALVVDENSMRSISSDEMILSMKAGILTTSLTDTMSKLREIQDNWQKERIKNAMLASLGLSQDGQGRYSFTMRKGTNVGDALGGLVKRVKDAMGKQNQP